MPLSLHRKHDDCPSCRCDLTPEEIEKRRSLNSITQEDLERFRDQSSRPMNSTEGDRVATSDDKKDPLRDIADTLRCLDSELSGAPGFLIERIERVANALELLALGNAKCFESGDPTKREAYKHALYSVICNVLPPEKTDAEPK